MNQAYDDVNEREFDEHTRLINAALYQIGSNTKLKPTIAELVRITGLHRNTISNRGWPSGKLKEIKDKRQKKLKEHKVKSSVGRDLKEQLVKALDEVCYWHNSAMEKDEEIKSLKRQLSLRTGSMKFYESETSKLREETSELKSEIARLTSLLNSV